MNTTERFITYGITAAIILGLVTHAAGTSAVLATGFTGLTNIYGTLSGKGQSAGTSGTITYGTTSVSL